MVQQKSLGFGEEFGYARAREAADTPAKVCQFPNQDGVFVGKIISEVSPAHQSINT